MVRIVRTAEQLKRLELEEQRHRWIDPLKKARSSNPEDWKAARRAARKVRGAYLREAILPTLGFLGRVGLTGTLSYFGLVLPLAGPGMALSFGLQFLCTISAISSISVMIVLGPDYIQKCGEPMVLATHAKTLVKKVEQRVARQAERIEALSKPRQVDLSNEPDNVMTPTAQHRPASLPEAAQSIPIEMPKAGGRKALYRDEPSRPVERSARAAGAKLWPGK
jgi:hypothetical protein